MAKTEVGILLAIIAVAALLFNQHAAPVQNDFQVWKQDFGIKYESMFEEAYRERVFLENLAQIKLHNSNEFKTYTKGINQFTGMTQEEFAQNYLGLIVDAQEVAESNEDFVMPNDDYNWNDKGAVTPVKDQGQCGSCWAFSATGGLEGLSFVSNGELESFSESQLVDCSGSYGNQACNGGLMDNAFKFVKDKGIVHESDYPYKAVKQTCKIATGPFKISGFTDIKNCNDLASALTGRPISIAVDATNWSAYKGGVFSNCSTRLNHGVLLVGVKSNNWVVKNSWGPRWGESGFIQLQGGNTCGLCNVASYPNK
jgi:C1A family cysteine protease